MFYFLSSVFFELSRFFQMSVVLKFPFCLLTSSTSITNIAHILNMWKYTDFLLLYIFFLFFLIKISHYIGDRVIPVSDLDSSNIKCQYLFGTRMKCLLVRLLNGEVWIYFWKTKPLEGDDIKIMIMTLSCGSFSLGQFHSDETRSWPFAEFWDA